MKSLNYFLQDRFYPDVLSMNKQQKNNYLTDIIAQGGFRRRAIISYKHTTCLKDILSFFKKVAFSPEKNETIFFINI